ncbi:MAG: small subunit ribosomal protein S11 [Candidatus Berkelbacteria bacterium Licking1014_96]|uniref:Small ribosomal subunit protein uS11 n=1 Tax=Candidatus Berkelbacteria bacterium Licking1014_96 TaxID=2017149 RepID=A0A554LHB3_9BACT|nr:MAG: small subunit ribosomal protein S11 [Candidatus Berkelbacteria bacterium Licking1014_96]
MRIKKEVAGSEDKKKVERKPRRAKKKLTSSEGNVYIKSSFNNTIINFVDPSGGTICWASAGASGFKGTKKSTPYAASVVAANASALAKECGLKKVKAYVKGIGTGRESAVRAIAASGIEVTAIIDQTPIPHNGCRAKKARRP